MSGIGRRRSFNRVSSTAPHVAAATQVKFLLWHDLAAVPRFEGPDSTRRQRRRCQRISVVRAGGHGRRFATAHEKSQRGLSPGELPVNMDSPTPKPRFVAGFDSPLGLAILDYIFLARDAYRLRVKAFTATAEV